jgi:hypothetical protein
VARYTYPNMDTVKFADLLGKTLSYVDVAEDKETITFTTDEGEQYRLLHDQDCCEKVYVEDIAGDLADLVGLPLIQAEESSSEQNGEPQPEDADGSWTWTFYKLATNKGGVTLRWLGSSNGWYSESVAFFKV